jgi:hypothetical protein
VPDPELSDSAVQRLAEADIIAALAADEGLSFIEQPGRVALTGDVWVEVDARTEDGSVFVEAYARQGSLKGAQLKKIGQDVLKLALLKREADYSDARVIIAFASEEARNSVRGWLRQAAESFGVELLVVSISSDLRAAILSAQSRQLMVNIDATVADLAEDVELGIEPLPR